MNEDFDVAVNKRVTWVCTNGKGADFVAAANPRVAAAGFYDGITLIGRNWIIADDFATKKDLPRFKALRQSIGGTLRSSFTTANQAKAAAAETNRRAANSYTEGDGIEYKWLKPNSFTCSYGTSCFGLTVRATEDCQAGVYVEINILDKSGTVVDWANDSVPALASGRSAKLIFETFERAGTTAQVATTTCHR
jgi:hypothetical protein